MKEDSKAGRRYHHGNLRAALIEEALQVIETEGAGALNLRDLARRLGVSHGAPAHHFPDKAALLTAIATEGYEALAAELEAAAEKGFLEAGLAYVRFAVGHPGHVRVMFEPSLYREDDGDLQEARSRSRSLLLRASGQEVPEDARRAGLAGWCLMHGFALLWLQGNLREAGPEAETAARNLALVTFSGRAAG